MKGKELLRFLIHKRIVIKEERDKITSIPNTRLTRLGVLVDQIQAIYTRTDRPKKNYTWSDGLYVL